MLLEAFREIKRLKMVCKRSVLESKVVHLSIPEVDFPLKKMARTETTFLLTIMTRSQAG